MTWNALARGAAIAVACLCAHAQEPPPATTQPAGADVAEPATPGVGKQPLFRFDELSFELGFESEYRRRQITSETRGLGYGDRYRQRNTTLRFEETLGMDAHGSIINDRLLRYDLFARWGLSQERFREERPGPDLRENPHGQILEYDGRLQLFPAGKFSLEAWASQLDDRIPRPFLPSLDRRRERYGAGAFFNDPKLPMSLTYESTYDRLHSDNRELLDDEDRRDELLRYEATWQPSQWHSLRLEYEYDRREEKYSGGGTRFDTTRNYLTLDHALQFGEDHRSSWQTLLRFNDETGDLARDTYEASPRLRLQWTDSLSTTFRGQYLRESFQGLSVDSYRGDAAVTHVIDDWMTNTADFYGLREDVENNADVAEWGGGLHSSLSRETPWGRLGANISYTHTKRGTSGGGRQGVVLSESITFRDPLPAQLAHQNIIRSTILVTDATRTRVYFEGSDYFVAKFRGVTALSRVRNGRIADRETVLVSYLYQAFSDYELSRDRLDFRIQHDFKFGLTPYYAGSIQDEDIGESRLLSFRARNVNRHRIGLTYRRPRWSAGVEYETNDDGIDPYDAVHLTGDAVFLQKAQHQLTGNFALSRFRFDGTEGGGWNDGAWLGGRWSDGWSVGRGSYASYGLEPRDTTLFDAGMSYRYLLGERVEASAGARYRFENDSLFGETHGVDLTTSIAYRIGLFSVLFEVEYDMLDLPGSHDGTLAAWLKLKREIPVIGRR
jgi:hypothetical protein